MAGLNIRNFPDGLLFRLKVQAAAERKTLRDLVIIFLAGAVKERDELASAINGVDVKCE